MRKLPALFAAALLAATVAASPAGAALLLSELCDPQLEYNTDRFIEIFNTGPGSVDLSGWSVVAIANNADVATWNLSGTLPAGQARVCGYTTPVTAFTVHFTNATWTWTAAALNWNGRAGDGAKLRDPSNAVVDQVLATATLFENATLVRNPSVVSPTAVFNASEWTSTAVTYATNATPGSHNGSTPPAGGPVIANIVTDPASPGAGIPTHVQASITDTAGAVVSATLAWGPSSGSLPNTIPMSLVSDSTWRTTSAIPAQSAGASVFYRIQAQGPAASTQGPVLSFTISGSSGTPPTIVSVGQMSDSTLLVFFSEPVEVASAETAANYSVGALVAVAAAREPVDSSRVLVTVRNVPEGSRTLTVNGVADLNGDIAFGATRGFYFIDVTIPPGYYTSTTGLTGSALRVALHNLIKNHTVRGYDFALTAFATTDVKPNGKIWDMYSDVPGGTPPYEYAVGETGQGATEGLGYNREHTWPQSWFNSASPMDSDLHQLYPTDAKVNGYRSNYPYGEVGTATTTSLNGSRLGPSVSPGYSGTVFEPIDAYKGDLARAHFYMATRYFGQDGSWPGSPSADGANLLPWAVDQLLAWSDADPPSWKERMRNAEVHNLQNNRNPFVDHPEFVAMIWDTTSTVAVGGVAPRGFTLLPNTPNPFAGRTAIAFDLERSGPVTLGVFDVGGRRVRTLLDGARPAGLHRVEWDGRDDGGAAAPAGLYFCRLEARGQVATRRMALAR